MFVYWQHTLFSISSELQQEDAIGEPDLVYEQYHKCCMLRWAVVHHRNQDPQDNRIENLEGMTYPTHLKHHRRIRQQIKSLRVCSLCCSTNTYRRKTGEPLWYFVNNPDKILCSHCYDHSRIDERRHRQHNKKSSAYDDPEVNRILARHDEYI